MALFPVDEMEALLILRAKAREPITYGETFRWFGYPFQRFQVGQLTASLMEVDDRQRALGRPDLAVLVVRKSDGLPGQGWWLSLPEGAWTGPFVGPKAQRFVGKLQENIYRFWADRDD